MYKSLLIVRYLSKRRLAWVSLASVCLCATMVLVVYSVMGGWLDMFRQKFKGLSGSVVVQTQRVSGFAGYEEMIARIERLPTVRAAAPIIETFGLINIINQKSTGVQIMGLPIDKIGAINKFPESLYRQHTSLLEQADDPKSGRSPAERTELRKLAERNRAHPTFDLPLRPEDYRDALPKYKLGDPAKLPGMIAGQGVLNIRRESDGTFVNRPPGDDLYRLWAKLTVLGVDPERERVDDMNKAEGVYWIVDDSRTAAWQYDSGFVYVAFDILQRDLSMDAHAGQPARTTAIHVAARDNVDLTKLRADVQKIVDDVLAEQGIVYGYPPRVETWEQMQAQFLAAVEKEVVLVTVLFAIISLVAVMLIFAMFYTIVVEKTRDIGIVKSVGATSAGVASVFLGYGAAIGLTGGLAGLGLGYVIVHNINWIHDQMGRRLNFKIWDPSVYAFDTIPNTVPPSAAAIVLVVAILASVLGALVPAVAAARLNPVEALRFE